MTPEQREKKRAYMRAHRKTHKRKPRTPEQRVKHREYMRAYNERNKGRRREYRSTAEHLVKRREYQKAHRDECQASANKSWAKIRLAVLSLYGMQCAGLQGEPCQWDVTDERVLEIDHVHNDGKACRKAQRPQTLLRKIRGGKVPRENYQLLCSNCNSLKELIRVRNKGRQPVSPTICR